MSVGKIIHDSAKIGGANFEALRVQGRGIRYHELNDRALKLAAALKAMGANRSPVGIIGQRNWAAYIGVLGAIYAGCHYVPINTKYTAERVNQIIEDASIQYLIGGWQAIEPLLSSDYILNKNTHIFLPDNDFGSVVDDVEIHDQVSIDSFKDMKEPETLNPEDLAYIMYTSGSTGRPKGVQVTHGNLEAFLNNMDQIYEVDAGFRASQTFDLSFDLSVCDIFFTWANCGTLCVLPEEELLLPSEYIIREKISFWYSVPTLASFMDKFGALKEGVFPTLRYSLFCGEPLPMELALKWMEAAPNSTVENLYGPTEATIHLTRRSLNNEDNGKTYNNGIVPIGLPYPDHTVEIVDDKGTRVKRGETGEITYKGPQITKGYLNDSEKTKDVFIQYEWDETREIWYKSGDLGFFNNDGDLECLGRKDNQIKIAGRRVEIGEIESIIRENTKLKDAVIVPVRNGDSTVKSLVAFTMVKISEGERAHLDEANDLPLEKIFRPSRIVYVENFPLLESGKTNRKKLEAMAKAG